MGAGRLRGVEVDAGRVQLRRCGPTEDDAQFLLKLRNEPLAREMFVNPRAIPWMEHWEWFCRAVGSRERLLLLASHGGRDCGYLRYDLSTPDVALVSISISPAFRGRGLAASILAAGTTLVAGHWEIRALHAEIRLDNRASIRSFERAGYSRMLDQRSVPGHPEPFGLWCCTLQERSRCPR
jgi:RimJ/RimL family protein N-acetyltransferase